MLLLDVLEILAQVAFGLMQMLDHGIDCEILDAAAATHLVVVVEAKLALQVH